MANINIYNYEIQWFYLSTTTLVLKSCPTAKVKTVRAIAYVKFNQITSLPR